MIRTSAARLASIALVSVFCFATPVSGADMLLSIPAVEGSSTVIPGGIDVFAYSHGLSNVVDLSGGGAGTGKASFQDLHIVIGVDKSTPKLMDFCAKGEHLPEATLFVRSNTVKPQYLVIKLEDAAITSFQMGGSGGEEALGTASCSIAYRKITTTTVIDGESDVFTFDLAGVALLDEQASSN
jgi:type VI secretion system secreted protein Hcp